MSVLDVAWRRVSPLLFDSTDTSIYPRSTQRASHSPRLAWLRSGRVEQRELLVVEYRDRFGRTARAPRSAREGLREPWPAIGEGNGLGSRFACRAFHVCVRNVVTCEWLLPISGQSGSEHARGASAAVRAGLSDVVNVVGRASLEYPRRASRALTRWGVVGSSDGKYKSTGQHEVCSGTVEGAPGVMCTLKTRGIAR